jgi:hypothetical protein
MGAARKQAWGKIIRGAQNTGVSGYVLPFLRFFSNIFLYFSILHQHIKR